MKIWLINRKSIPVCKKYHLNVYNNFMLISHAKKNMRLPIKMLYFITSSTEKWNMFFLWFFNVLLSIGMLTDVYTGRVESKACVLPIYLCFKNICLKSPMQWKLHVWFGNRGFFPILRTSLPSFILHGLMTYFTCSPYVFLVL